MTTASPLTRAFALALLLALPCACTLPDATPTSTDAPVNLDASVLMQADRDFADDVEARGFDGWISWLMPDAVKLDMNGEPTVGVSAIAERDRPLFDDPTMNISWEPDLSGWLDPGARGYTRGTWTLEQADADGNWSQVATGRYLTLWVLVDGRWRIEFDLGIDEA